MRQHGEQRRVGCVREGYNVPSGVGVRIDGVSSAPSPHSISAGAIGGARIGIPKQASIFLIASGELTAQKMRILPPHRSHSNASTAMVFLILAGATVFGRFLVLTRLPFMLTEWVTQMNMAPAAILLFMMGCYLIGGCIMDALAFLLISLPLFEPLVTHMGYDLIWFGQVVCLVTTPGASRRCSRCLRMSGRPVRSPRRRFV